MGSKISAWGWKCLWAIDNFPNFPNYLNGRFPLANGLLIVPDGEVPKGKEKINLKQLYKMFKDANSHMD